MFLPIRCPLCSRTSAVSLSAARAKHDLDCARDIVLHCVYDDVRWTATPTERAGIAKHLDERMLLATHPWLQMRQLAVLPPFRTSEPFLLDP